MEKTQKTTRSEDGYGNTLEYMNWKQFQQFVTNRGLWVKGDTIQVKNREGCVISTTILIENGEEGEK